MHTALNIDGANCSICFNEAVDNLGRVDGVRTVQGSIGESCIDVEHDDVPVESLASAVRDHLHGFEMYASEIRMVPIDPVAVGTGCSHLGAAHQAPLAAVAASDIVPSMTLGEIVNLQPTLAAELEQRGLDYCCHGTRTLAAAAVDAGLDPQTVADELSASRSKEPPAEWSSLEPADLADHIDSVHHRYLWSELPRIGNLVDKIVNVHGDRHPELVEVQRLYGELRADFEPHLIQEEEVIFPMVRRFGGGTHPAAADIALLAERIDSLSAEHEVVGGLLEDLRRVTNGYATPADGCASYAACYVALAGLEADTHLHVHKENNVLFPAVLALRS
ncbi:MAG: iron-sulfur cluster repair di-iron protein [Ilumatobacteraceae bacterium]